MEPSQRRHAPDAQRPEPDEASPDGAGAHLPRHERPARGPIPDRFAFLIVNTALGGGMSSRLFQKIREERGLAYSVYSYHSQYTEAGLFTAYAGTTPARAREVVALLRRELADVARRRAHGAGVRTSQGAREGVAGAVARGPRRAACRGSGSRRSPTARSSRSTRPSSGSRPSRSRTPGGSRKRVLSQPMTLTVLGPFGAGDVPGAGGVIRVGVVGACGRMGQMVCRAVADDPELTLVAAVDRSHVGESIGALIGKPKIEVWVGDELHDLLTAEVEVAVDFTIPTSPRRPRVGHGARRTWWSARPDSDADEAGAARPVE